MSAKKLLSTLFAGLLFCSFSTSAFAELFSVSAGIPVMHSFSKKWSTFADTPSAPSIEADGMPSGALAHVKFPIMVGLGAEMYETKLKSPISSLTDAKLSSTMFDVFYLLPIPIVNITIGLGAGTVALECTVTGNNDGDKCSDFWDGGMATQVWGQFGFPIFPFIDLHLSVHQVNAKIKKKEGTTNINDENFGGNMVAFGASIIF